MRTLILTASIGLLGACAETVGSELEQVANEISADLATAPTVTQTQLAMFGSLAERVGKTYRGVPVGAPDDAPGDIQVWSWALGGTAIKIQHAIEDGSYGGDTYVYQDVNTKELVYVYITNAGFRTEGVMTRNEDGSYVSTEAVEGHPTVTKVRATTTVLQDGSSQMRSEYLDNGEWKPGAAFDYALSDAQLPVLRAEE